MTDQQKDQSTDEQTNRQQTEMPAHRTEREVTLPITCET